MRPPSSDQAKGRGDGWVGRGGGSSDLSGRSSRNMLLNSGDQLRLFAQKLTHVHFSPTILFKLHVHERSDLQTFQPRSVSPTNVGQLRLQLLNHPPSDLIHFRSCWPDYNGQHSLPQLLGTPPKPLLTNYSRFTTRRPPLADGPTD